MQNAKCKHGVAVSPRVARAALSLCILTFAFCIAEISAQQQPGMPGSMGMTGGIVASNVPPKIQHVTFSQRLGERLPLDARLTDESGREVALSEYFGKNSPSCWRLCTTSARCCARWS